uniref:non-specific serine/threonine protein kinase n=1 Tax=Panagrellus redivivus TaxID=6233 RepID=A0A7E4VCI0_PANRE
MMANPEPSYVEAQQTATVETPLVSAQTPPPQTPVAPTPTPTPTPPPIEKDAPPESTPKPIRLNFGQRFGDWRICEKLDEGGFGQVYKVEHIKVKKLYAAMKAEPSDIEGGSAIKLEAKIMIKMNARARNERRQHIVYLYYARKRKRFNYMIVTLLGDNLKNLKMQCKDEKVPIPTWVRIGIQCLYCIKLVHDVGYIHRDIKPGNFIMGHHNDINRCRLVHVVDFGLARAFAVEVNGQWIVRRARGSVEFRGTARYCSPAVHEKFEQGRKDDLFSLMYMLIEFHCGLPWQREKTRDRLEMVKLNVPDHILMKGFPEELQPVIPYLRSLNCYNRPDYSFIYDCCLQLMRRLNVNYTDKYAWENEEQYARYMKKKRKRDDYENAEEFFNYDPIGINDPPQKGEKTFEETRR